MSLAGLLLAAVFLASLLLNLVWFFRHVWTRRSPVRQVLLKLAVAGATLAVLVLGAEIALYFGYVRSHDFGHPLATRRWFQEHWGPLNAQGYRDREHPPEELSSRKVVFVAGDSFVAGYGTDDRGDRFPDVLQRLLGDAWAVVNIARNGWGTAEEREAMAAYPATPAVIVLAHHLNDIETTAERLGRPFEAPALLESRTFTRLRERSYLLDFLYWRLYRFRNRDLGGRYGDHLAACYADPAIAAAHQAEIQQVLALAREHGARLVVLLFPELRDLAGALEPHQSLAAALPAEVTVIDLARHLEGRPTRELIVHGMDGHPSVQLHAEVAGLLRRAIAP